MIVARSIVVRGFVQGVGYRYFLLKEAERLALTGWVENREDRSVAMVVEGEEESIAELIERLHEGPPVAVVETLEVEEREPTGQYRSFDVRRI
jgi:acylphosphatase